MAADPGGVGFDLDALGAAPVRQELEAAAPAGPTEIELLTEIRDALKARA